jgi:superfamily II DNA or RNA helicase
MPTRTQLYILLRHPVRFVIGSAPDKSRFVFGPPSGPVEATATEAVGALSGGIRALNAHSTVRAWAGPAILAQRLLAAGSVDSPSAAERQQLMEFGAAIGPTASEGQTTVQAFLAALAADSAISDAADAKPGADAAPAPTTSNAPTTFIYRIIVSFLDEPGDNIASVSLRLKPLDRRWGEVPAAELWAREQHHFGTNARQAVQAMLDRLSVSWPAAAKLRHDDGSVLASCAMTRDDIGQLAMREISTALLANRIDITWPRGFTRDVRARAVVRLDGPADSSGPRLLQRRFRLDWRVSVNGRTLSDAEFEALTASRTGMAFLDGNWVHAEPSQLRQLADQAEQPIDALDALRAAVSGRLDVDGRTTDVDTTGWLEQLREQLVSHGQSSAAVKQPPQLRGQLREYQLDGVRWMAQLVDLGLGGILADDMGLGKTVMLIALHLHLNFDKPTLVVCPASVLATWEREVHEFAPETPVRRFHGPGRSLDGVSSGFVVTTYSTMLASVEELRGLDWGLVVADEAQHVKNADAKAAWALRSIESDARMALTGTPVENSLSDVWAILDWTTPGLLGSRAQFRRVWSAPIELGHDDQLHNDLGRLIRPFLLRRRKDDPGIAPELPPKIETDHRVELTSEQSRLYETVVQRQLAQISSSSGMERRGLVMRLLTELKQICNHPAQFLRTPTAQLPDRSGKLIEFDDLLDEVLAEDGAALVFTQFARMGELLSTHLESRGIKHQFLHGGTPVRMREQMVQAFQSGEVSVFLLSLRAAGTGLTLTRADHVIHYDRWWNPAVEDQATDRAHRIGQDRVVQVHRLIAQGTIEESIAELITAKRELADAIVNAGAGRLSELSDSELADLVQLRRE